MSDHDQAGGNVGIELDLDEPPLFDLDQRDETAEDEATDRGITEAEGVALPFDVLEHGNGELPDELLVPIGVARHRLHATAAAGFETLRAAAAEAGIRLTCTDSYRSLAEQQDLKRRKPNLSATPGRSVHGWGFAVDVSIDWPPKPFGRTVLRWLEENAPTIGWYLGRPEDEPWHWVFRGPDWHPSASVERSSTPDAAGDDRCPAAPVPVVRALLGLAREGAFDVELDAAVRAFQGAQALTADGIVGPITWAALLAATAPADRTELVRDSQGDAVVWLQRRLGITDDGNFGPKTEAAVITFQRTTGLHPDGKVGPKTWAALTV